MVTLKPPAPQRRPVSLAGVALLLLACASLPARAERLRIDSAVSSVQFDLAVAVLLRIGGEFTDITGHVEIDWKRGSLQVEAEIDVYSARMGNAEHEAWLRSAEFFDAERYPSIYFSSREIPLANLVRDGELRGFLTVRDSTQPVRLRIREADCLERRPTLCALVAEGSIQRRDFGMRSRRGTLGDTVRLRLRVVTEAAVTRAERGAAAASGEGV